MIGRYLDQLAELAEALDCPVITGETKLKERQSLYDQFRHGELPVADLIVRLRTSRLT